MNTTTTNDELRRQNAMNNPLACLVCPHVQKAPETANFIARIGDGYVASCDENCVEFNEGTNLGMIHLGHILSSDDFLLDLGGLPINVSVTRNDAQWVFGDVEDDYIPIEGDFIAAPKGARLREIPDEQDVFVYVLGNGQLVTLTLDDGFQIVAFWETKEQAAILENNLTGEEALTCLPLGQVRERSKRLGIRFLGPNFLCKPVDAALIT